MISTKSAAASGYSPMFNLGYGATVMGQHGTDRRDPAEPVTVLAREAGGTPDDERDHHDGRGSSSQ